MPQLIALLISAIRRHPGTVLMGTALHLAPPEVAVNEVPWQREAVDVGRECRPSPSFLEDPMGLGILLRRVWAERVDIRLLDLDGRQVRGVKVTLSIHEYRLP